MINLVDTDTNAPQQRKPSPSPRQTLWLFVLVLGLVKQGPIRIFIIGHRFRVVGSIAGEILTECYPNEWPSMMLSIFRYLIIVWLQQCLRPSSSERTTARIRNRGIDHPQDTPGSLRRSWLLTGGFSDGGWRECFFMMTISIVLPVYISEARPLQTGQSKECCKFLDRVSREIWRQSSIMRTIKGRHRDFYYLGDRLERSTDIFAVLLCITRVKYLSYRRWSL